MSHNKTELSGRKIPENTKFSAKKVLSNSVDSLGLSKIQRHMFLCTDQTIPKCCPKCCSKQASLESWEYLKKRLKEPKLD